MMEISDEELELIASSVFILGAFSTACNKRRRKRKFWARRWLQRRNEGIGLLSMLTNELMVQDPPAYKNFLRMNNTVFSHLLKLVLPAISKQDTVMRECIQADMRLAVTLRFLATGETYRSLMFSTRIAESTLSTFVPEVLEAIYEALKVTFLKVPKSSEDWKHISSQFETMWQMSNCIGAMDGKHVAFRASKEDGSTFFNYKGFHSIILLAVVDAQYKFTYVSVGSNGRINDGRAYAESSLAQALQENKLNLPADTPLPGRRMPIPYTIVADSAFPLTDRIMKPYPARDLTHSKRIFNYRLSRARRVSENAFGIIANRFRILLTPINLSVTKVESIVLAICALHNFLLTENHVNYTYLKETDTSQLVPIERQGANRSMNRARVIRTEYE